MCGIVGVVGYNREHLSGALKMIKHRGPDYQAIHKLPGVNGWLGHARLSVIDLDERSNQPFLSRCGRYVLVFNGEIYNFPALRRILETEGCRFRTQSDTEVLLEWLIRFGMRKMDALEGMFAFGFIDTEARTLILARDPIGEKPLYYSVASKGGNKKLAFASEIKALLGLPDVDKSLDRNGLKDFLRFLYTAPPHTLYRGIRELPPGHYFKVDLELAEEPAVVQYYSLEKNLASYDDISFDESAEIFRAAFTKSVASCLISDVSVGLFLSSGLDSNAILSAAVKSPRAAGLQTFTAQYKSGYDESTLARRAAERYGLENKAIIFSELSFHESVDRIVDLFSQPFGNSTAVVSDMLAHESVKSCKVCLAGDGGDELLVGYSRYKAIHYHHQMQALPARLKKSIALASGFLPERGRFATGARRAKQFAKSLNKPIAESFLDWCTYLDSAALSCALGDPAAPTPFCSDLVDTFRRYGDDPVRAATILDMKSFVPFNLMQSADRTSMAHSLELRSPFLSTSLVHATLGLPSKVRYIHGKVKPLLSVPFAADIPVFILDQPKHSFNPPIRLMLQQNLKALDSYLCGQDSRLGTVISKAFVADELRDFRTQRRDNSTFLWGLATLENWLTRAA